MYDGERLLTVFQAAELLGLQPSTLRAWTFQKRIPIVRVGRRSIRIPLSVVRRIVDDGRVPSKEETMR